MNDVVFAFLLTTFAGLSTGIGSLIALIRRKPSDRFLSLALGFSAGVMIYVSFVEIFPSAHEALAAEWSAGIATWGTVAGFFAGIAVIAVIDRLVPESANPHELPSSTVSGADREAREMMRMGVMTAFAIAIHNFPEGFATFMAALHDPQIAVPVAVAIAIHNIPEGIAVAVPIHRATGSRRKAFTWSFLSGLAEPAGALLAWLLLETVFTDAIFGFIFASVAGVMVYISLDELLPTARRFGNHHLAVDGLIAGMALMALSLLLLG